MRCFFEWVSVDDLSKGCHAPVERVYAHLNHLRKEHKLLLRKEGREIQVRFGRNKREGKSRKANEEEITPHRCQSN